MWAGALKVGTFDEAATGAAAPPGLGRWLITGEFGAENKYGAPPCLFMGVVVGISGPAALAMVRW